ncbi:MAG TPA: ornithine cyclodeaminase family protein [Anaerovoracaceae bacterium]|nr:ornithine cyclodeaminase family protein [Anaerovoracaceae bacterium]
MFDLRVLNKEEIKEVLNMNDVIKIVEEVYRLKAEGGTTVFPLIFHEFEPGAADMDIKSGWLKGYDIFGLKVVSWFGGNEKKGIPALIGIILVLDATTGTPIGILDGAHVTGMRTGASGAIGAKYLARSNSETLLMVGAGHIAAFEIAATLLLFPTVKNVMIHAPLHPEHADRLAASMPDILREEFGITVDRGVGFHAVRDLENAVKDSDIIITATPSKTPLIKKEWVKPGTHFSCVGADMSGKEEIDPEIFADARVFTDDTEQCINVGEIEIPVARGILKREAIAGEIGDVVTGRVTGRESDGQITVFDATGTALLDLLTGKLALDAAAEKEIGTIVKL